MSTEKFKFKTKTPSSQGGVIGIFIPICEHELKQVRDKRYPYNPWRCTKCGYEP